MKDAIEKIIKENVGNFDFDNDEKLSTLEIDDLGLGELTSLLESEFEIKFTQEEAGSINDMKFSEIEDLIKSKSQ